MPLERRTGAGATALARGVAEAWFVADGAAVGVTPATVAAGSAMR